MKRQGNMIGQKRHVRVRHMGNGTTQVATLSRTPIVSLAGHVDERKIQDVAAQFEPRSHDRHEKMKQALVDQFGHTTSQR